MLTENQKKWVEALRSGEYEQGTMNLCKGNKFCCLGVACDIYEKETGKSLYKNKYGDYTIEPDNVEEAGWLGETPELKEVQKWLGLVGDQGQSDENLMLTQLNDGVETDQLNFNQIADFIESEPKGLFV